MGAKEAAAMQRDAVTRKKNSFRALIFYVHIRDVELPLYLSQILVRVSKQLLDMKLLETKSERR